MLNLYCVFFAMRYIEEFNYSLSEFLDDTLICLNKYSVEQLHELKQLFIETLKKAKSLFGDAAFLYYDGNKWSTPAKMIYDPLMQVLSQNDIIVKEGNIDRNVELLKAFYQENSTEDNLVFDGKHQSKEDIEKRIEKFDSFVRSLNS